MVNQASQSPIRVLCVDDIPDVRAVMRMVIDAESDMECVGEQASADSLIEEVRRTQADVVVLDATIPGGRDPISAMDDLASELPHVKTIIYTGLDAQAIADRARENHAWAVVSKDDSPAQLINAVREVAAGKHAFR